MEGAEEKTGILIFAKKEVVMAKFHLSYNEQTGALRIDETGATIQSEETTGFKHLYSDDNLFVCIKIAGFVQGYNYANDVIATWEYISNKGLDPLIINLAD